MQILRFAQIVLVVAMSMCLGSSMQLVKLSSVDAAARQFYQTSHFGKQSFLTAYGLCKASANLALGWWVSSPADVKWGGLAGWVLALMVPLLAALAKNWATVVLANAVLGFQQGLAWTCTVLLIVPLFKSDQRGLALGLNEALGYICLAAMAPIYGQLERRMVGCHWVTAATSMECLTASQSTCVAPDGWVPECVGQCQCGSYTRLVARVGGVIVAVGMGLCIALILLQLYGPAIDVSGSKGAEADSGGPAGQQQQLDGGSAGWARGMRKGGEGCGGEVELGLKMGEGGDWEEVGQTGLEKRVHKHGGGQGVGSAGWEGGHKMVGGRQGGGVMEGGSNGSNGDVRLVGGRAEGAPLAPASKASAFLQFTLGWQGGGLGCEGGRQSRGKGRGSGLARAGEGADCGGDVEPLQGPGTAAGEGVEEEGSRLLPRGRWGWLPRWWQPRFLAVRGAEPQRAAAPSQGLGVHGKGGRSTLVLCVAGMACNMVASLAWGMLLSWARDLLLIPGPSRDLMASTYQFVMAATLLLAAQTSDHTGRRWWMVGGLCCSAAGLFTAACGAGFNGALLLGVPTVPAALASGATDQHSLQLLQYGYLQLASCLLGMGTGGMYGTMAAAVVDHSTPSNQAINMATFRFWRDLGYALGSFAGLAADASSTEVSMLVFGVLSLTIACCVAFGYKEAGEAHTARTLPSFDEALTEPENDEKVQRLSLLDRIGTSSS